MSFRLLAFPWVDPCDLLPVLLEFDVKGLVAKNGGLFSSKYDPLPPLLLNLEPTFKLAYLIIHTLLFPFPVQSLPLRPLHHRIVLSLPSCPLVLPLVSPWLSHVLFQSTGAQGGNEIWPPSLNGHAHILCNYLRLRAGARFSIYKSVPLSGPSRLLKPYPADASQ